jgi:hypothetical protein
MKSGIPFVWRNVLWDMCMDFMHPGRWPLELYCAVLAVLGFFLLILMPEELQAAVFAAVFMLPLSAAVYCKGDADASFNLGKLAAAAQKFPALAQSWRQWQVTMAA